MKKRERKRVVCVIPARYGSTRLPGKLLMDVKEVPLIVWTYNRAVESQAFDDVYVATDDRRIKNTVEHYNGKAIMTSSEHTSGTDRVYEAVRNITGDYIVNLQGDEPQVPIDILREMSKAVMKIDKLSLLTCVSYAKIEEVSDPNVVKVVLAAGGDAIYFSRAPIPFDTDKKGCLSYRHNGIYGFSREGLELFCNLKRGYLEDIEKLEQLRALEHGMKIHCLIRDYESISIDTRKDLEIFRSICGDA